MRFQVEWNFPILQMARPHHESAVDSFMILFYVRQHCARADGPCMYIRWVVSSQYSCLCALFGDFVLCSRPIRCCKGALEYLVVQFNKPWNETKWIDFWGKFSVLLRRRFSAQMQKFHLIKPIMVPKKTLCESDEKFSAIIFVLHGFFSLLAEA